MKRITLHDYFDNPELYRRLAERDRARAIGEGFDWLIRRIRGLAGRVAGAVAPRHPARWIQRLG